MPFGIASGPEEYQRRQHEFLVGLRGVINIADDIWLYGWGDTKEDADIDHNRNLVQLLERCAEHDLQFREKLQFKSPSVTLMGHKLTHKGVEPDPAKVAAIREVQVPTEKAALQRFPVNVPIPVQILSQPVQNSLAVGEPYQRWL